MTTPDFPAMTRMLLHMEFADGTVREFEAEHQVKPEMTVTQPLPDDFTFRSLEPHAIPVLPEPSSVELRFEASQDRRYPMTMRTYSTVDRSENFRRLAKVRDLAASLGDRPLRQMLLEILDGGQSGRS